MTQTQKRAQEKTEYPKKKSRQIMEAWQKTGWGKTVLLVICLLFLCLSACLSGCRQADPDGKGGNPDSTQGTAAGDQEDAGKTGETNAEESGENGELPPEQNPGEAGDSVQGTSAGAESASESEGSSPSVKEWLRMEDGDEPRTAWIVAFDALNVRRFCYSRGTVVGQFAAGQQITVTGPDRKSVV